MAISANSINHYTGSLDNIKSILENGFYLQYCSEDLMGTRAYLANSYPMVCFCDIPLSQAENHMDNYGHFGIGLTKQWANSKGLNPVLYLEKDSYINNTLIENGMKVGREMAEQLTGKAEITPEDIQENWIDFQIISAFSKNYEGQIITDRGKFTKEGKEIITLKDVVFYNER